jgi:pyrroline-5-carboxylate reductase
MTVAIFGAGVMGETLLAGWLRAGRRAEDVVVTERRPERAAELRERYGVEVLDNVTAAKAAGSLVLVVKPQDMGGLLDELAPHVAPGQLVVSLAAGITTAFIERRRSSTRGWRRSRPGRTATSRTWSRPRSCCGPPARSCGSRSTSSTP